MAYDEQLAERVRALLDRPDVDERRMFGGIAFMVAGNMAVGVLGDDLIVRGAADDAEALLAQPGARPFDFTGRPAKGTLFVGPEGTAEDDDLARWVRRGEDFAAGLPPK